MLLGVDYLIRRAVVFAAVVWLAVTLSFFIPRTPQLVSALSDLRWRLMAGEASPALAEQADREPGYYERVFHLDRPLHEQYLIYLSDLARLDLNYSMYYYPKTVREVIGEALPWTVSLLGVSTLLGFALGSLLGVLLAWPRTSAWIRWLTVPLLTFSAVPFYLLGLILAHIFSVMLGWLPIGGGHPLLVFPSLSWAFILGTLHHAILPTAAITLSVLGFWALSMRGMVVTVLGQDYMVLAEAKGLKDRTLMLHYAARNALLAQMTALALSVGNIVMGAVLVEMVFAYPGIGTLLQWALRVDDYPLMQGITLVLILAIALVTLVLDLTLPLLDRRIRYGRV